MNAWLALALLLGTQEEFSPTQPTKEHELLKAFVGEWDTSARFWMDPNAKQPMESKGTYSGKLLGGGLWLVSEYKGEMMGQSFEGRGFMGYDVHKKKFVGCWIDSMMTHLGTSEGAYDEKGRIFTFTSEGPDMSGRTRKWKEQWLLKGADRFDLVFYLIDGDKEIKTGEIEFHRKETK